MICLVITTTAAVAEYLTPMRLSRKSDYALRALTGLAAQADQTPVPLRVLAAGYDIPKRFLEQIMLDMRAAGWVASVAGRHGGYRLALPPDQISVGAVVRLFDGVLAPIGCVSVCDYRRCSQEESCRFRRLFLDVRNYTAHLLDATTLAEVLGTAPVTRAEFATAPRPPRRRQH